jgi:hypothetical protein
MGKTSLKYFLSLLLFISGGSGLLSAHSASLSDSSSKISNHTIFIRGQHDHVHAVAQSSGSDKDKQPRRSTDIEGAEEEWTPGKKYLEGGNGVPCVSTDLVPTGPFTSIISGLPVRFFHSEEFSRLYLLYRLIRI